MSQVLACDICSRHFSVSENGWTRMTMTQVTDREPGQNKSIDVCNKCSGNLGQAAITELEETNGQRS